MYLTSLPDHSRPGFDETLHFSKFGKQNIVFNAASSNSHCDRHVGCLSLKTVLNGEEWYGIDRRQVAVRPGYFLMLNDDQEYSCRIDHPEKVQVVSIFFKKTFAAQVLRLAHQPAETLLDDPFTGGAPLEFFQTLEQVPTALQLQLNNLLAALDYEGYSTAMLDERLAFLLGSLVHAQNTAAGRASLVQALKPATRHEVFKRVCIARDILHSCYKEKPDLEAISRLTCLSVPQLVRQFKAVFHATPHQYLVRLRLAHAAELLANTQAPVHEITWQSGFENTSAFCRAFKAAYGMQPLYYRKAMC